MKQTILVTGGTGFIGSHTTVELIEAGYDVVIVDDLSNSKIEVLDGIEKITGVRPAFEKVDLRDKDAAPEVPEDYWYHSLRCQQGRRRECAETSALLPQQYRFAHQPA